MSHVTCRVSRVTCHVSHVTFISFIYIFFFGQSGEAFWWRVSYQRGLPRLVFKRLMVNSDTVARNLGGWLPGH